MSASPSAALAQPTPAGPASALRGVGVIAWSTLLEQANRRLLWWLSGVALALVLGLAMLGVIGPIRDSLAGGGVAPQDLARLFARGVAGVYALAAVVILGMGIVGYDLDSGAVVLFVTRPVTRGQYLVGRYLGNAVTLALTIAVMGLGAFAIVLVSGRTDWLLLYEFTVLAWNAAVVMAVMVLVNVLTGIVATAIVGFLTWEVVGNVYLVAGAVKAGVVTGMAAKLMTAFVILAPHVLSSPLAAHATSGVVSLGSPGASGGGSITIPGPTLPDFVWSLAWIVGSLAVAGLALRRREL